MAVCLAREYTDESICSAGAVSPLAMTSYLLARRTHAPGLTLITTSGGYVDVAPRPMLLGLGEALDYKTAVAHASGDGTYHRYYQSGRISHETVATAQVDRFGRTNTIEVRSPSGRVVRLPGQGGMADVANMHQHFLLYVTRHSPLALVESVDVSSAGRGLLTDEERLAAGLRPGVVKVVTNLCIFELDHASRELQLVSLHPGVEIADVERETGFEVVRSPSLDRTQPPSAAELELIATEIDPLGIRHLEFMPARERGAFLEELIAAEERLVIELAGSATMAERSRVLVVGAGLMGSQIGCEYSLRSDCARFSRAMRRRAGGHERAPGSRGTSCSRSQAWEAYLQARKVFRTGDSLRVEELGGGVSNIVLAVSCEDTRVVVKQALPRLRVEDEWLAKRERAINEARALRLAHTITPGCVPALLDVDRRPLRVDDDGRTGRLDDLEGPAPRGRGRRSGRSQARGDSRRMAWRHVPGRGAPGLLRRSRGVRPASSRPVLPHGRATPASTRGAVEAFVRRMRATHALPRPRGLLAEERARSAEGCG